MHQPEVGKVGHLRKLWPNLFRVLYGTVLCSTQNIQKQIVLAAVRGKMQRIKQALEGYFVGDGDY